MGVKSGVSNPEKTEILIWEGWGKDGPVSLVSPLPCWQPKDGQERLCRMLELQPGLPQLSTSHI